MTIKAPQELKDLLAKFIKERGYHFDDPKWNEDSWKIIFDYYDEHPVSKVCEWSNCNKPRAHYKLNGVGDVVYILCEEHEKEHNKHVRTFRML